MTPTPEEARALAERLDRFSPSYSVTQDAKAALTAMVDEVEGLRAAYTGAMEDKRKWKRRYQKAEAELRALKGGEWTDPYNWTPDSGDRHE